MVGKWNLLSIISAASLSFFVACGSGDSQCYRGSYKNVTDYNVVAGRYTSGGIGLDDPKNPDYVLDAGEVDWQVYDLERCLNENFAYDPVISDEEAELAWCLDADFSEPIEIKEDCIVVKVPDDIYRSDCTGKLLFPCDVDEQLCRDKGLEPSKECPCDCRAIVQEDNYVITEPRLEIFRAELARIVTNCNNPWVVKQVRSCLKNPHFSDD